MSYHDADRLELILELIDLLRRRHAALSRDAFLASRDDVDLAAFRLSVIGENSQKLSPDLKARHAQIDWSAAYAMRNVIVHEYLAIDARLVWSTISDDLEALADVCRAELGR